jgi:hypothetical protein
MTLWDDPAPVSSFRGRRLPIPARLAGYGALIDRYDLNVPLHHQMAAVADRNARRKEDGWLILPAAQMPRPRAIDHLVFALKYEGVQLLTLSKVFAALGPSELEQALRERPTSAYVRRLCFLYEWFGGEHTLDLPDSTAGAYVDALDETLQYGTRETVNVRRFRVRNNLPGSAAFCPLVFRTHDLDVFMARNLSAQARAVVDRSPKDLIARAAAFMLLSDSKASFAIEGETPPRDRIARWGHVIAEAGRTPLSVQRLVDIQRDLIGDDRFVAIGLREDGGFVGRHDPFGNPEPEHVSARAEDLDDLLQGLVDYDDTSERGGYDPVLAAAAVAFGFVYIHPFEDGNGRIHRFLMHHVLAERHFTPREIVFPISSVILDDIARYKDVLERVSRPLLGVVRWRATDRGNVQVDDDTADLYRYFDATAHAYYLYRCLGRAVERDLPAELAFLERRDRFHAAVTSLVDMGERTLDLLLRFLRQEHGRLSRRAREQEFARLSGDEVAEIEAIYADLFDGEPDVGPRRR